MNVNAAELHQPRMILFGRERLLIEQHQGLFSYETHCVRVRTKAGTVKISGEGLVISFFGTDDMQIEGNIENVMLSEEHS